MRVNAKADCAGNCAAGYVCLMTEEENGPHLEIIQRPFLFF